MKGLTPNITAAEVVRHGVLRLTFADGTSGEVDVLDRMRGSVFEKARTPEGFAKVRAHAETGTVVWPGGADLAPDTLYKRVRSGEVGAYDLRMSALGTAAVALGSAGLASVLTHLLTSRRDLANRRRELRVEYLLSAYRTMADSPERRLYRESSDARAFEKAVADIQLLGSRQQVELATELAREMATEGQADPDPLLRLLRDDLRGEMSLEALSGKPIHLRIHEEPPS